MCANLATTYMGLNLPSPLVVSASPLARSVDTVRELEAAGAGAIVLFSLFEEQFAPHPGEPGPDPARYGYSEFLTEPKGYLEHVRKLKETVEIPIIGSLNATGCGAWLDFAAEIEEAGADAIELNIYRVTADPTLSGAQVEDIYVEILRRVRRAVKIPVALKLSPYFSNLTSVAARFDEAGADALVLFNRFYQPTIDVERRRIVMALELSSPAEARLSAMWIAMLKGQVRAALAATSGIHGTTEAVRAIMAGADVVMLCSVLLKYGTGRLADIHRGLCNWLDAHEHGSCDEVRGAMRLSAQKNPEDYTRRGYAKMLNRHW